jgi:hypothetical protein
MGASIGKVATIVQRFVKAFSPADGRQNGDPDFTIVVPWR